MIRAVTKIMRVSRRTFHCFDDFSKWQRVSLTSRLRLRPTFGLFLLFLLMNVAQSGAAQGIKFTPPVTYPAGAPYVVAAGDFNGDGKMDLVGLSINSGIDAVRVVTVLLGNGDGTFRPPISTNGNWGQGSGPYSIVVGDFDRDGRTDVVVTDEYLSVLKGNGDGTFKAPASQPRMNNTSLDLKVGDFNGDGRYDLVSSGIFTSGALQVLLGNGDGT